MRHRYLVTYDVRSDQRLRRVFRTLKGFGEALQYSVFQCDLSEVERLELREALSREINHAEDRVLIVDLGPAEGRAAVALECLGTQQDVSLGGGPVVV